MTLLRLQDNEDAYRRYKIRPRILVNVDKLDTSTQIFGQTVPVPFGLAPSAMHKLAHPDGEVATSRAAAKAGICMGLSSYSTTSLEEVAAQGRGNPYFHQMCVLKDRRTTLQLLQRAEGRHSIASKQSSQRLIKSQLRDTKPYSSQSTPHAWEGG